MKKRVRFKIYKLVFAYIFFISSCSVNVLDGLASKTSDEYLIEEAIKANNAENYDLAITIITTKISSTGQQLVQVKELLAGAYAGKCGLNFAEYATSFMETVSTAPFKIMMTPFVGALTDVDYCKLALTKMESIGSSAQRTANQNTFVAILGLALMGTALRQYADIAPALGDGTADVNLCVAGVTDSQIEDVIIGFGYFTLNISYVSASLLGSSSFTALNNISALCTVNAGASCSTTDPTTLDPVARAALIVFFRRLVNTSQYGIGVYDIAGNDANIVNACN